MKILILLLLFPLFSQAQIISTLEEFDITTESRTTLYSDTIHFEAPNWSPDGRFLIYNSMGSLFRYEFSSGDIEKINTGNLKLINNDHGISPDGKQIVISCYEELERFDWKTSQIYLLPIEGGNPRLVTKKSPSFWHGWSPNGKKLAFVGLRNDEFDIYSISIKGGKETKLTFEKGLDDGPDYSPDGKYIYYNSISSGVMEIWRMDTDGSNKIRLTDDAYSNWFPHPSPDGKNLVYLAYLEDQGEDHPPMKKVALRLIDLKTGSIKTLCEFTGGQGTINVPSWSPDGKKFAFVSYESITKSQ